MYAYSGGVAKTTARARATKAGVLDTAKVIGRRLELGLLQREVAARAGISPQHMADIEAGRRNGSPPVRLAIAKALRTTLSELVAEDVA
jgi:transcriptional regulator with XRE-family HTH domain